VTPPTEIDASDVHSEAVKQVTSQIIHEIEPLVGALRLSANSEIPFYDSSLTRKHLDRLSRLLEALSQLRRAAYAPVIEEFDLAAWLTELERGEPRDSATQDLEVDWAGRRPAVVRGDKTLTAIVFCNALRNALEATAALEKEIQKPVVVTWGETEKDYWLSIVDNGIGLPGGFERIFGIGTTSKIDHLGMGLAMARQAAASMGGDVLVFSKR
jgi:signal transduction histidine kinase